MSIIGHGVAPVMCIIKSKRGVQAIDVQNNCGIYRFYNKINGKSYIGKSNNLKHRYNEHIILLNKNMDGCSILNSAWQKYGADNFGYEILCYCDESELNETEMHYIKLYDSYKKGYNCTRGGDGILGYHHTDEAKKKIGDAFRGKPLSEEFRKKLSDIQLGKHLTEEHKRALSEAWTDDRKRMMTETRSGKDNPNYGKCGVDACNKKPVICNTGEFFFTITDAAKWCGVGSKGNISSCCRGKSKSSGVHPDTGERLTWRYATDNEIQEHIQLYT